MRVLQGTNATPAVVEVAFGVRLRALHEGDADRIPDTHYLYSNSSCPEYRAPRYSGSAAIVPFFPFVPYGQIETPLVAFSIPPKPRSGSPHRPPT